MTLKSDHTAKVMELLEAEVDGELTTGQVAKGIVDAIYDSWSDLIKDAPSPLKVGEVVKFPWDSKAYHVAWGGPYYLLDEDSPVLWIITSTSSHGTLLGLVEADRVSEFAKRSTAKAGAPGNNADGWKKGDRVSITNRRATYEILEVGDKCVLMRCLETGLLMSESNAGLKQHYRKERA